MTLHYIHQTTSVLDDLRNWHDSGNSQFKHLSALRTSYQTAGRGRIHQDGQHTWESKPNQSLLVGIVVQMAATSANRLHIHLVNFIAAVAMCQTLLQLGLNPKIKWPNDILVNNKKICGILSEFFGETNTQNNTSAKLTCTVGIGLNIYQEVNDFSTNLTNSADQNFTIPPTSVMIENPNFFNQNVPEIGVKLNFGTTHNFKAETIDEIGKLYYKYFQNVYNQVIVGNSLDVDMLHKLYLPFGQVNNRVKVTLVDGQVIFGVAQVLADSFALHVRTDNGQVIVVQVGDVVPIQTIKKSEDCQEISCYN